MAHLPTPTAIFSPSIARIAASTAKDWRYVDAWLTSKFQGRSVPSFERNPETLKALLSLATVNETADEERELVARAEFTALREIGGARDPPDVTPGFPASATVRERILAAVQNHLTREGSTALNSMATLSCQLSAVYPDAEALGRYMILLHAQASESEQMRVRVHILRKNIEQESIIADELLRTLRSDDYRPADDLARQNVELQRKVKTMAVRIPEIKDRVATLNQSIVLHFPTIEQTAREESEYRELLSQKKNLDTQVLQFYSLPDDVRKARLQLDSIRAQLRAVVQRRDDVFENLVERQSPRKHP